MGDNTVVVTVTRDDMKLIVDALSAYQHNTRYRELLARLHRGDVKAPWALRAVPVALAG